MSTPTLSLERGNLHVAELASIFKQWVQQIKTVVTYDDPKEPIKVRLNNAPPLNLFAGIIGDVVHNYRTSLDLLAIALVRLNGNSLKDVYFPFCKNAEDLDEMIKKRNFHKAGQECVDLLKTFKPYKTEEWNPLRALHDLDVLDKHQAIIPAVAILRDAMICQKSYDNPPMSMACLNTGRMNETLDGTKVGEGPWLVSTDWQPPYLRGSLDLVFDPSTALAGRPVIPTLSEFSLKVSEVSGDFFKMRVGPAQSESKGIPLSQLLSE